MESGAPCPIVEIHPDGVTLLTEDRHVVTHGGQEGSATAHLFLTGCEIPPEPPPPPVVGPAGTPAYMAWQPCTRC